jgi:UDP-N-acetylmuramate dehydrogenase
MALGLGSNMIVRDGGVPGVVVRLGKAFARIGAAGRTPLLRCGGEASGILVSSTAQRCGDRRPRIPARQSRHGGAGFVRMNGGAYGREVQDILVSATLVSRSGELEEWPAREARLPLSAQ